MQSIDYHRTRRKVDERRCDTHTTCYNHSLSNAKTLLCPTIFYKNDFVHLFSVYYTIWLSTLTGQLAMVQEV